MTIRAWPLYRVILASATALFLGAFLGSTWMSTPQIVTFDVQHTLQLFMEQTGKAHLSRPKMRALSRKFSHTLTQVLHDYARKHKLVILNTKAVVVPVVDVTRAIEEDLAEKMKEPAA